MNKLQNRKRLIPMAAALLVVAGLAGCADDASGLGGGTTSGTTGGTTSGTTAGTTGGTTSGTTAGTTAGTTGGTTSGTTAGTTAGTTGGTTSGTTAGTTAGTTGGTTSGTTAGTTAGTTGGTTSGTTAGTTSGTTGGTTSGTTAGTTSGTTGGTTSGTTGGVTNTLCDSVPGSTYTPIQLPNAVAADLSGGGLVCLGCQVNSPNNVIDGANPTDFATLSTPVNLLGGRAILSVQDTSTTYAAGSTAGIFIFDPAGQLLTLTLLQNLSLTALNNGAVVATQVPTLLGLDLLGAPIIGTTPSTFFSITPNQPFNELRLSFGSTIGALGSLGAIQACVSAQ